MITFYISRNSYEKGSYFDYDVPEDFKVEFNAEFFSTKTGGYEAVDSEASMFQNLIKIRPSDKDEILENGEEYETHSLTAYIHFAPSVPFGPTLCLLTGKNIPYITAELYKDGVLISSDIEGRIPINPTLNFENTTFIEKIKLLLGIIDWRNISFFKKVQFNHLRPGKYLIKIYRENPLIGEERKFIGYKEVEIDNPNLLNEFLILNEANISNGNFIYSILEHNIV